MIDPSYYVAAALFGAIVGSFLNVCIYRLPRHEWIVWPGSHCTSCGTPIAWRDNIPILSYLLLLGRCRECHKPIAVRYLIVEIANTVGYVIILWYFGLSASAVLYALFYSALLVVVGTDLSHKIIPNVITIPGIVIGLIGAATVLPIGIINSGFGIATGGGLLWILAWASPYLFGKEGMGGGDIKLLAMVGAFLGWKAALLTIMIGSLTGSVVCLTLIAAGLMKRDEYIPFGPFLVVGAILSMFFAHPLLNWYQGLFSPG